MRAANERERALLACTARVTKLAFVLTRSWQEAEDIAQEAMILALWGGPKGGQKWSGEGDPWKRVAGNVRNVIKARRREGAKLPIEESPTSIRLAPTSKSPERLNDLEAQRVSREERRAALEAEAEDDDLALRVLALYDDDVTSEAEQAARLDVELDEVKKTRKRLRDAAERVKRKERRS
jgi:DNA-directed RNA polymerase specialized sigma24 family protein